MIGERTLKVRIISVRQLLPATVPRTAMLREMSGETGRSEEFTFRDRGRRRRRGERGISDQGDVWWPWVAGNPGVGWGECGLDRRPSFMSGCFWFFSRSPRASERRIQVECNFLAVSAATKSAPSRLGFVCHAAPMAAAPAAAAATPNGAADESHAKAQAELAEAKAKPLPTVDSMRELFVRFDYNKNKMLSLAELDKVQLGGLMGGG